MVPVNDKRLDSGSEFPDDVALQTNRVTVDQFVIEGILLSYLEEMDAKKPASSQLFRNRLHEDESFLKKAHSATMDAVLFSSLANTVETLVYEESLTRLLVINEPELHLMRQEMFDFGVSLAARNAGGSATTGRLKERTALFHAAAMD